MSAVCAKGGDAITTDNRVELPLVHVWEGALVRFAAEEQRDADQLVVNEALAASEKEWVSLYNEENIKVRNLEAKARRLVEAARGVKIVSGMVDGLGSLRNALAEWKGTP